VECKFYGNVISHHKDRMFFHFNYRYDGNGQARVAICSKAHPRVKTLLARCGGLILPSINNMEVPTHILNGRIKDVAMEMLNLIFKWKDNIFRHLKWKGLEISPPLTNNTKGPNKSTNNNI
jgi:hypothetical protein